MSRREATLQQRDPLAAHAARPITILVISVIPAYAVTMAWLNREDLRFSLLVAVSLLLTVATSVLFAVFSSPMRAPFTSRMFVLVVVLSLTAYLVAVLGLGSGNAYVRDDWAASCLALYLLAAAPYRPAREIAAAGVLSAAVIGLVTLIQLGHLATTAPPIVPVVVATVPVLAFALTSAVFAHALNQGLDGWEHDVSRAVTALDGGGGDWIARSVQQDRVTILNQGVVPFFAQVLQNGVADADRLRARELSDSIRRIMVNGVDKSWLDGVVEQGRAGRGGSGPVSGRYVHDELRRAQEMSTDQRTAVRALLSALYAEPSCDPEAVRVSLVPAHKRTEAIIVADFTVVDPAARSLLDPYLAVMRILFPGLQADAGGSRLTVRFSYDHW